ncbi:cytochrome bd oxidase small subunit CydS [Bacillus sp. FJAT-29937]
MENFFIFYAPFIVVALAIAAAFWLGPKDGAVHRSERK